MKKKTIMALMASAMLTVSAGFMTSCTDNSDNPTVNDNPNAQTDAPAFDENNIVLAFVGMSDVHIMVDPAGHKHEGHSRCHYGYGEDP